MMCRSILAHFLSRVITGACEREEQTTDYCDMHFPLVQVLEAAFMVQEKKTKASFERTHKEIRATHARLDEQLPEILRNR